MTERDIFLAVLDLLDPAARAAYLDGACRNNPALRARVDALLRSHDAAGSFLGTPAVAATPDAAPTQAAGLPPAEPANEEVLTFLGPPQRPGSLGRLGHYEILAVLGRGGFGIVFRAFDEVLQRVVAVKVLAPQLATTSPARKRFLREARSSARVRHENVVQVYAVEEQPLPYLVMEFIPGETLQQRLDRVGPLELPEAAQIGGQIAEGLAAAHAQGVIHRDIKPANVLLEDGPQVRVKITDFGLARAADEASLTQSGVVAGTPMYMSPEQARGEPVDYRTDLFSLGSVLYTVVAGRPPFRANGTLAVLKRVCEDTPRPIPEVIPEVPVWLCDVIGRLQAKDPKGRYATAREVADELTRCLGEWRQGKAVAATAGTGGLRPPLAGKRLWVFGAAVVALLVALGVGEATGVSNVRGTVVRLFSPAAKLVEVDPPDADDWEPSVAALSADEQVKAVAAKLKQLNPGFDGVVTPTVEGGAVVGLELTSADVTNLSPVRALKELRALRCPHSRVADLSPLRGLPLRELAVQHTQVSDLGPLADLPLEHLNCSHTKVADLSPLKGRKLITLYLDGTKVTDLTPLDGMPLKLMNCRNCKLQPKRDGDVLRRLPALEEVNSDPVAEFLQKLTAGDGQ